MVDQVRVLRLARSVSDAVAALTAEAGADAGRRSDPIWLPGVKYLFVIAIEACIDISQHVCAAEKWGPPADNGDAMRLLARHGLLPAELADSMRRAVGFRNVLVHEYVGVSDDVVRARLHDLGDLSAFVATIVDRLTG